MTRILLTTITLCFVSQSLLAQEQGNTIYNARSLSNRDWAFSYSSTQKDYNSKTVRYVSKRMHNPQTREEIIYRVPFYPTYKMTSSLILSLKPEKAWDEGNSWILKVTQNRNNNSQTTFEAWKGDYCFYADHNNADNLVLKLACIQKYTGKKRQGRIVWQLDTSYEKKGVRIDIPLYKKTVPRKQVSLSLAKGFSVDSKGTPTILREKPFGAQQTKSGRGSMKWVFSTEFIGLGETIKVNDYSSATILRSTGLGKSLPTGCRLHNK